MASETFLEICQRVAREVGIDSTGDYPTAVLSQTGDLLDVVHWVIDAWEDLQNMHGGRWRWLRRKFTLETVASDGEYAYGDCDDVRAAASIDRFKAWRLNDVRQPPTIYLKSSGASTQGYMIWASWERFNQVYEIGNQSDSFPRYITVDPQDNIVIGAKPNAVYVITGEYNRGPQIFDITGDGTDVPELPVGFHRLISYYAIERYGFKEAAPEVIATAKEFGGPMLRDLEINQLPSFRKGGPLA